MPFIRLVDHLELAKMKKEATRAWSPPRTWPGGLHELTESGQPHAPNEAMRAYLKDIAAFMPVAPEYVLRLVATIEHLKRNLTDQETDDE